MELRPVDARDLVRRSIEGVKTVADAAQVRLVEQADSFRLFGDADRLVQTLTNLLGNAIKFSPAGSCVDVVAHREGGAAHFSVQDRGRGIPPDKLERVFGRFEQVDASDAREKGGTGLGLAISRSIVQQHGGRIWVESTLGQGSTFHFVIPLGTASGAQSASEAPRAQHPTVLVVDDDTDVLEVVGRMLAQQGYQPLSAQSGEEAIAQALGEQPSAILLDLAMPGLNGWQTLGLLKDDPRTSHIPVLLLSGLEQVGNERTEQTEGWISKPVTPEALRDMIGHVLARSPGPPRIMLVEDDLDLARVLREVFAQHGVQVEHAASGDDAIALSARFEPDLLLLDLALPDGDGSQVVDWFRQHDRLRRVALVVYTARDLGESERERLQLGPTEHLTKSRISPDEVRRRVLRLLDCVAPTGEQRAA
jgi:CheY-like chemotaxis protein